MRELAHLTSQTRMAPVETIVPRLQRNVRQTAAATHKQASLVVVGSDILVHASFFLAATSPSLPGRRVRPGRLALVGPAACHDAKKEQRAMTTNNTIRRAGRATP